MPVDLSRTSGGKQTRDTWQSTSGALVRRYQRAFAKAANLQPIRRLDSVVDRKRDRFLTELGARANELHDQLLRAMRDNATSGDTRQLATLCGVAIDLQDIRSDHRQAVNDERLHMLTTSQEVSARLSPTAGVASLLERAAITICDLPGLDRAMVFQREGGALRAAATAFVGHDEWARDCQAFSASTRYHLVPQRPETRMIRHRCPAIITDALNDPNAFQPITQKLWTGTNHRRVQQRAANYVAAPVIAYGEVVATIHGDAYFSDRVVDEVDRDVLASFAASLGQIVERAILIEQLQSQQRVVEQIARTTTGIVGGACGDIPPLESDQQAPKAPWQSRSEVVSKLTRREYEILQLMTKGAANREIATTIFVSVETVKWHVKHILQKFGVANRGQAVATYLESLNRR
jgi:LuxR family transcriptional regulator, regulator of acetate metabolism